MKTATKKSATATAMTQRSAGGRRRLRDEREEERRASRCRTAAGCPAGPAPAPAPVRVVLHGAARIARIACRWVSAPRALGPAKGGPGRSNTGRRRAGRLAGAPHACHSAASPLPPAGMAIPRSASPSPPPASEVQGPTAVCRQSLGVRRPPRPSSLRLPLRVPASVITPSLNWSATPLERATCHPPDCA